MAEDEREFTLGGKRFRTSTSEVTERLAASQPEPIRKYFVEVAGRRFPVKQAVAEGLGIDRAGFTSQDAYRVLRVLGFEPKTESR